MLPGRVQRKLFPTQPMVNEVVGQEVEQVGMVCLQNILQSYKRLGASVCHRPCHCIFSYRVPRESPNFARAPAGEAWGLGLAKYGILDLREGRFRSVSFFTSLLEYFIWLLPAFYLQTCPPIYMISQLLLVVFSAGSSWVGAWLVGWRAAFVQWGQGLTWGQGPSPSGSGSTLRASP